MFITAVLILFYKTNHNILLLFVSKIIFKYIRMTLNSIVLCCLYCAYAIHIFSTNSINNVFFLPFKIKATF